MNLPLGARRQTLSNVWTTCYSLGELQLIEVQVLIRSGLPRFDIIGLPQNVIREGKDRILSALAYLGIELPAQKVLVSLIPGDRPKEGSHFDLPILVGILKALGFLYRSEGRSFYWGELGLDGSIREQRDILAHLLFANRFNPEKMVHGGRTEDLSFIDPYLRTNARIMRHVQELIESPSETVKFIPPMESTEIEKAVWMDWVNQDADKSKWNFLKGSKDQFLFWSLAALGRHHILLEGPPGVGKTSWCFALHELQSPLPFSFWNERFRFQPFASARFVKILDLVEPVFESPHHSSSNASIIGGGTGSIDIGSITRANGGILFLDELNEFSRDVLESLREPLESKTITIARRGAIQRLSADFQLLAAMNPCKCGNSGSRCTCTTMQFHQYRSRVSAPLRDRFHAICQWKFADEKTPDRFDLRSVRGRLSECSQLKLPRVLNATIPEDLSPRRQRKWIEFFISWCRWHGIAIATDSEATQFNNFLKSMENPDERDEIFNTYGDREEPRDNGTENPGSYLVS